jgi:L-fuculose-phosphate aldolase
MIITPTRRHPDDLRPDELIEMDLDGALTGDAAPSLEWRVHAAVYRVRPDVRAIAHTHSPFAVARSFSPAPVIIESEERVYLGIDQLDVAPPAPAGSPDLAAAAVIALGTRAAALLGRHGVLAVGATPREAFDVARTVEHLAIVDLFRARATPAPPARLQPPPGPCGPGGDTPRHALGRFTTFPAPTNETHLSTLHTADPNDRPPVYILQLLAWMGGDAAWPEEMLEEHADLSTFRRDLAAAERLGVVERDDDALRLTERGWQLAADEEPAVARPPAASAASSDTSTTTLPELDAGSAAAIADMLILIGGLALSSVSDLRGHFGAHEHAQLDDNLDVAVRLGLVRRQSDTIELTERGQAVAAAEIDR